jgi:hypothetical protein
VYGTTYPNAAVEESGFGEDGENFLNSHRNAAFSEVLSYKESVLPVDTKHQFVKTMKV